jgi:glucoamylase
VRSLKDGKIFDQPPQTVKRYRVEKRKAVYWEWRFNNKCRIVPTGKTLRIATQAPALVHWSHDGWQTSHDLTTWDTGLGIYVADLPTGSMDAGHALLFTFYWPEAHRWEGADFSVNIQD